MNKRTYFLEAMKAQCYKRKRWVVTAFSLIKEGPDDWQKEPYPYRLVPQPNGYAYVDPSDPKQLIALTDAEAGKPLYRFLEGIDLVVGEVQNLSKDVRTTYGNVLVNYITTIYPFQGKIPFLVGKIKAAALEGLIIKRLQDDPATPVEVAAVDVAPFAPPTPTSIQSPIYVSEYLKFADAMFYLTSFAQVCTPAATRKTMTSSPELIQRRTELLAQYAGQLNDPAVIAKISAELVKIDKDWIKGDLGEDFYIGAKSYNVVRAKKFGIIGAQKSLEGSFDTVHNSLSEGWDINTFTLMNNTSRSGSFERGRETQLGGEAVKWLLRASSNMNIPLPDCGTRLGMPQVITEDSHNVLGFGVVSEKGTVIVTEENYGEYLGKKVMVRSPMFCKLPKTDLCVICCGPRLSVSATGLSNAVSQYGNTFMAISLKAMHGKELTLAHMDYRKELT